MQERLNLLAQAEPYIGKYYSQQYVRSKILQQTDGEIEEQDKAIVKEIQDGTIPDPSGVDPIITGEMSPEIPVQHRHLQCLWILQHLL